jgi:hypothetical protein
MNPKISALCVETGEGVISCPRLFPAFCGEWGEQKKTEYPFIKYIPIVAVMSGSHVSGHAMIAVRIIGNRVTH